LIGRQQPHALRDIYGSRPAETVGVASFDRCQR
jgi:hypothetical protein